MNLALASVVDRYPSNVTYVLMRQKWDWLLGGRGEGNFLVLGDSSALHGIDPDILDQELSVRSLNLATVGPLLSLNDAWMLRTFIERNGPPKGVLVLHVVDVWSRPLEAVPFAKLPLPWRYWTSPLTPFPFPLSTQAKIAIVRYLPLSTDSETVASYMMYPWREQHRLVAADLDRSLKRGFWALSGGPQPDRVLLDAREQLRFIRSRTPAVSGPNRYALTLLGEMTERYRFDVFLAVSPVFDGLAAAPDYRDFWEATARQIQLAVGRFPRIHFAPDLPTVPLDDLRGTVDHLSLVAARRFTRAKASQLASVVGKAGFGLDTLRPAGRPGGLDGSEGVPPASRSRRPTTR